ncbi:flagellar protein FliT [Solibacillus sp. FSL H8-0523]|uniref:flagellar protein FliT n=1 Tax=Solibacillus sp. FSL H8-0523 TaxID=2954511 RepID=UPI003100C8A9
MEQQLQQLLQISAKLYEKLTNDPEESVRDEFIEDIQGLIDQRGELTKQIVDAGFSYNADDKTHRTLFELDKGIRSRLERVMITIKEDMKNLQNAKKNEQQYTNPYGHVQVMDGMYYDKKK